MGLDTVELVMDIEETFDIRIPDAAAEKMATVGDTQRFIVEELAGKPDGRASRRTASFYRPDGSVDVAMVASSFRIMVAEQAGLSESDIFDHSRYVEDLGMS